VNKKINTEETPQLALDQERQKDHKCQGRHSKHEPRNASIYEQKES
jgi:hypothetical protein